MLAVRVDRREQSIAMPTGVSMPPPAPCRMRKITSSSSDWDRPQSADAAVKSAIATMNVRLVPKRSPTQPDAGIQIARLTRYPTMIPSVAAGLTSKLRAIAGSAT